MATEAVQRLPQNIRIVHSGLCVRALLQEAPYLYLGARTLEESNRKQNRAPGGFVCRRLRQCWYSAAAAKNISEESHDKGSGLEDKGEAALALERRLHAPPAIQFVSESRRGGFNKVKN